MDERAEAMNPTHLQFSGKKTVAFAPCVSPSKTTCSYVAARLSESDSCDRNRTGSDLILSNVKAFMWENSIHARY